MADQKNSFRILQSPLFLIGLCLLLLNDFFLKESLGNWLTGKLSDVSGLFIFPLFLTAFFPQRRKWFFWLTALGFTFWKLPLSDPFIYWFNDLGLQIGRTKDSVDLLALVVLPFSYAYSNLKLSSWRLSPLVITWVSCFAFVATSIPPRKTISYTDINKTYVFNYSRNELIGRLNRITIRELDRLPIYLGYGFESSEDKIYTGWKNDTLAVLLDAKYIHLGDTIHYQTHLADFIIEGTDSTSSIRFLTAYRVVPKSSEKDYRKKAIHAFEKRVIKKLKKEPY